jgi:hypothetical protein
MVAAWNNEKIKVFVKNTLGCGCPEKVFERIEVSELHVEELDKEITRIVVGDTLLIYITGTARSAGYAESITSIGHAGKNDRDANSYNRFRLVVAGLTDAVQQAKVSANFSELFNTDGKMHIHFVDQELVAGLN